MEVKRICIYPKDIQRITGKSERYGRLLLAKIKERNEKELETTRQLEDQKTALILGVMDRRRTEINLIYDRQIEDVKHRLKTEKDLTEIQRQALYDMIKGYDEQRARELDALVVDDVNRRAALDLSARPYLVWNVDFPAQKIGTFDTELVREFFQALSTHGGITLHVDAIHGINSHHIAEATFKSVARALREAVEPDPRMSGVLPSTKGAL